MGDVQQLLESIERIGTHAQKIEEYKKLAARLFAALDLEGLKAFLSRLAEDPPPSGEAVPTMISRQVLQDFVQEIFTSKLPPAQIKELGQLALAKLKARLSSFEEPMGTVSEKIADILQVWHTIFFMLHPCDLRKITLVLYPVALLMMLREWDFLLSSSPLNHSMIPLNVSVRRCDD